MLRQRRKSNVRPRSVVVKNASDVCLELNFKLEFVAVEHVLAVHCLTLWGLHINSIRNTVQYRLYFLVGEVKVGLYSV